LESKNLGGDYSNQTLYKKKRMNKFFKLAIIISIYLSSCTFSGNKTEENQKPAAYETFLEGIKAYCGMELEGEIIVDTENPDHHNQNLQFLFEECPDNEVRITALIPDKMINTIILTLMDDEILLKHDVRNMDFSPAQYTMYGGFSDPSGTENKQRFPVHNFGQTMWPGYEDYSWEIRLGDQIIEYIELSKDIVNKHYIIKIPAVSNNDLMNDSL
jgi:hypothetical protein